MLVALWLTLESLILVDEDCFNFNLLKTTGAEGAGLVLLFLLFGVL